MLLHNKKIGPRHYPHLTHIQSSDTKSTI